jgi:5'-methylthioadenosine phosphorylase
MPKIAIIGGTGIYNPDTFETIRSEFPDTPFGKPSDPILIGKIKGVEVAFLFRHGKSHQHPPSSVPYRANMYALRQLGCEYVISACAVGSLKEEMAPGDLVIADQIIDFTKRRDYTYFYDQTVHISLADPFCPYLNGIFADAAKGMGIKYHKGGAYVCIEGPRFSSRAESNMFRILGGDIIGMTAVPEAQLARELGMCYCSLATVTDYDAWKEEAVDIDMVLKTMAECLGKVLTLLENGLPKIGAGKHCDCIEAAKGCGSLDAIKKY